MADDVIELNQHADMTVEQTLAKAQRHGFEDVVVVGRNSSGITVIPSGMEADYCHWLLAKGALKVLAES